MERFTYGTFENFGGLIGFIFHKVCADFETFLQRLGVFTIGVYL